MLPLLRNIINVMAPNNPSTTPTIFCMPNFCLKNTAATINVNRGVKQFNTPAVELFNFVCAVAKSNAGKPLPRSPTKVIIPYFLNGIFQICFNVRGNKHKNEKNIRIVATCAALYTFNPFFIKINELPQIKESKINNTIGRYSFFFNITLQTYQNSIRPSRYYLLFLVR